MSAPAKYPELPLADYWGSQASPEDLPLYTADQMRAYADAAEALRHPSDRAIYESIAARYSESDRASRNAAGSGISDAPQAPDMAPPATSRDRWMYRQGWLAALDARSHAMAPATTPVDDKTHPRFMAGYDAGLKDGRYSATQDVDLTATTQAQEDAALPVGDDNWRRTTPMICVDFKQATELLEMFGGEPTTITLMTGPGHSGDGLYAVYDADPEGAVYLGATDEEAVPDAPTQADSAQGDEAQLLADAERWRTLLTMRKDLVAGIVQRHELADRYKPGPWTLQEEVDAVRAARAAMGGEA